MLDTLSPVNTLQLINTVVNLAGLVFIAATAWNIYGYKRRVKERYDHINSRLDHILVLAAETHKDISSNGHSKEDETTVSKKGKQNGTKVQ